MSRSDASPANPLAFWARASQAIEWVRRPRVLLKAEDPRYASWFAGGMLNTSYNAVDLHVVAGRAEQTALVFDAGHGDAVRRYSYAELRDEVARLAGAFAALGVERGDRVLVHLPSRPEAVFAMLACARLGAVHAVVSARLRANDLAQHIQRLAPTLALTATDRPEGDRRVPLASVLEAAIDQVSNKPTHCLVLADDGANPTQSDDRNRDWRDAVEDAEPMLPVALQAGEALYVLPTAEASGTPRSIVRDNGGHAVALKWCVRNVFGLRPGEASLGAFDLSDFAGHAYGVYGPLLLGATSVLHESGARAVADPRRLGERLECHRIQVLWASPTEVRRLQRADPAASQLAGHDLDALRAVHLIGSRAQPEQIAWCERAFGATVENPWSQAELGGPIAAPRPLPGCDVQVLGDDGRPLGSNETGHLALALPLPPGALRGVWQNDAAYESHYLTRFPDHYDTGDLGFADDEGRIVVTSRSTDRIAWNGHWIAPHELEDVLLGHADVVDAAVIGLGEGSIPAVVALVEADASAERDSLERALRGRLAAQLAGATDAVEVVVVPRLPRTPSGALPRGTLRKLANDEPYRAPAALEDPGELDALRALLAARGIGQAR